LCIGADTVVDVDGEALGKPRDKRDAERMIRRLTGRTHAVHTAVSLLDRATEQRLELVETTAVTFADLPEWLIAEYVAGGDGLDKAGAYGIQGPGAALVARIDGDFYTVMGFPLGAFVRHLPALGYRVAVAPVATGSMRA
jgi:septum formation protein